MDTESPYLALSEKNSEDIFFREKRNEWEAIRSQDCTNNFTANATGNFFPKTCCTAHKKLDGRELGLIKEEFRCSEMLCLCSKTYCCYDRNSNKYKFSSKGFNKKTLDDCGDGPISKCCNVLEEAVNLLQPTEDFEQWNVALQPTNRQKRDCLISTKNVL